MWVRPLGGEDPLEQGMATHSGILAQSTPWTEEPDGIQSIDRKESDMTEETYHAHILNTIKIQLTEAAEHSTAH